MCLFSYVRDWIMGRVRLYRRRDRFRRQRTFGGNEGASAGAPSFTVDYELDDVFTVGSNSPRYGAILNNWGVLPTQTLGPASQAVTVIDFRDDTNVGSVRFSGNKITGWDSIWVSIGGLSFTEFTFIHPNYVLSEFAAFEPFYDYCVANVGNTVSIIIQLRS